MIGTLGQQIGTGGLAPEIQAALALLAKARAYARDVNADFWDFAVEMQRLLAVGATVSDLRWLVNKGYVGHAHEVTAPDDEHRRFQSARNLAFTDQTCFVATDGGLLLTEGISIAPMVVQFAPVAQPAEPPGCPQWSRERRALLLGGRIVKRYRVPSPNQEAILAAFQEEGWPHHIDDPLSPLPDQCPKERLHSTIKYLNASQANRLIRFRGDGTGEGIVWEPVNDQARPAARAKRRRIKIKAA